MDGAEAADEDEDEAAVAALATPTGTRAGRAAEGGAVDGRDAMGVEAAENLGVDATDEALLLLPRNDDMDLVGSMRGGGEGGATSTGGGGLCANRVAAKEGSCRLRRR